MCLQGYYETTSTSTLWRVSRNSGAYWPLFSGLLPHWNAKWNYNQRRRQYATVKEWLILLPLLPWLYILTSISACQKSCQNASWAAWNVSSSSSCRPWQQAYSWTLSVARSKNYVVFVYLVLTLASSSKGRCRAERPLQEFQFEAGLHQHQIVRVRFQQVVWLRIVGQTETKSWNLSMAELSNNCRKNRPAITLLCRRTLSATVPQIAGRR